MKAEHYFYNCSRVYLDSISPALFSELMNVIASLPKRQKQEEINIDIFTALTSKGWSYDSMPPTETLSKCTDLKLDAITLKEIKKNNNRDLCLTATTLQAKWHSDYAKMYEGSLVHLEVQFGKVESMFKDFCGFRIARYERRLALGIEMVMYDPGKYFSHRRSAISGMAYFDVAKNTLPAIGFECPIWLIGLYA